MKIIAILITASAFLFSCTGLQKKTDYVSFSTPALPFKAGDSKRNVASYVDERFVPYYSGGNHYIKLIKSLNLAKQFYGLMPYKGHPKKQLVRQFISDLENAVSVLEKDSLAQNDKGNEWLPTDTKHDSYKHNIEVIGAVVQSAKMMERMGIYLTVSGVVEGDSALDDYYFSMLARAMGETDQEIAKLAVLFKGDAPGETGLLYPSEKKEEQELEARLNYAKALARDIRSNIHRTFDSLEKIDVKRVDSAMQSLNNAKTFAAAKSVMASFNYRYTSRAMSNLHIMNSADIDGFEDEMELTMRTKFNFDMIKELVWKVR